MTDQEYNAKLDEIERLQPDHPMIPKLRKKNNLLHRDWVKKLLAFLLRLVADTLSDSERETNPGNSNPIPTIDLYPGKEENTEKDKSLKKLYNHVRRISGQMAKLSNSFHRTKTNDSRAKISKILLEKQTEKVRLYRQIDRIKYGDKLEDVLKVEEKQEEHVIPADKGLLRDKLNSARSRTSQIKSVIKRLEKVPKEVRDEDELAKKRQELKWWTTYKEKLEKAK